jgi:hypothetical protein
MWILQVVYCALAAGAATAAAAAATPAVQGSVVVNTASGPIAGVPSANGTVSFLGVPYATPPLGALRWTSPVPPAPWTTPRDASQQPAACLQDPSQGLLYSQCVPGWGLRAPVVGLRPVFPPGVPCGWCAGCHGTAIARAVLPRPRSRPAFARLTSVHVDVVRGWGHRPVAAPTPSPFWLGNLYSGTRLCLHRLPRASLCTHRPQPTVACRCGFVRALWQCGGRKACPVVASRVLWGAGGPEFVSTPLPPLSDCVPGCWPQGGLPVPECVHARGGHWQQHPPASDGRLSVVWLVHQPSHFPGCLYLHPTAPRLPRCSDLLVCAPPPTSPHCPQVWIHGGGYLYGGIVTPIYQGSALGACPLCTVCAMRVPR